MGREYRAPGPCRCGRSEGCSGGMADDEREWSTLLSHGLSRLCGLSASATYHPLSSKLKLALRGALRAERQWRDVAEVYCPHKDATRGEEGLASGNPASTGRV